MYRLAIFLCLGLLSLLLFHCEKTSDSTKTDDEIDSTQFEMPSFEAEKVLIDSTLNELEIALNNKDVAAAVALFTPEVRDDYNELFTNYQDKLPDLLRPVRLAKVTHVSNLTANLPDLGFISTEYGWSDSGRRRTAELSTTVDGITFYITMEKIEEKWYFKSL